MAHSRLEQNAYGKQMSHTYVYFPIGHSVQRHAYSSYYVANVYHSASIFQFAREGLHLHLREVEEEEGGTKSLARRRHWAAGSKLAETATWAQEGGEHCSKSVALPQRKQTAKLEEGHPDEGVGALDASHGACYLPEAHTQDQSRPLGQWRQECLTTRDVAS